MKHLRLATLSAALTAALAFMGAAQAATHGSFGMAYHLPVDGVAEIVAATPNGLTLLYTSADAGALGLVDITDPGRPTLLPRVDVRLGGVGEPTSVAISPDGHFAVLALRMDDDMTNARRGFLRIYDIRDPRAVKHVKDVRRGHRPRLAGPGRQRQDAARRGGD